VQWIVKQIKDYEMAYKFLPCDRNQAYLLPPSLTDRLPKDHLAWFVLDAVEQIYLPQFYKKYRVDVVGNSAFVPLMMVALLIYSCCTGERSSRKIEKHCQTDVAYIEPVFRQIKDVRGFDRFMWRGIEACRSEWSLICATHNLLKLWRSGKTCWN
jgi:hypothetical protein